MNLNYVEVEQALLAQSWRFASTMANIPHEYSLQKNWQDQELYQAVVAYINEHGYKEKFFSKFYTYLIVGENKYWAMGDIINRAKLIKPS